MTPIVLCATDTNLIRLCISLTATITINEGLQMTEQDKNAPDDDERIAGMQSLMDNPFLLLFIGVAMPTVFYIVWGIMEIVNLPVAP